MADYSTTVTIINNTQFDLNQQDDPVVSSGEYDIYPPKTIPANSAATFKIGSTGLIPGTGGKCFYYMITASKAGIITFSYGCPFSGSNAGNAVWSPNPLAGINITMIPNPLPDYGTPTQLQFIIS